MQNYNLSYEEIIEASLVGTRNGFEYFYYGVMNNVF
jgi:hypothetical protein